MDEDDEDLSPEETKLWKEVEEYLNDEIDEILGK